MNGLEAAKELRKRHGDKVRIILVTGNIFAEEVQEGIVDGVLLKPCSKDQLMKCCQISQR